MKNERSYIWQAAENADLRLSAFIRGWITCVHFFIPLMILIHRNVVDQTHSVKKNGSQSSRPAFLDIFDMKPARFEGRPRTRRN